MSRLALDDKREAIKQWTSDPCGASAAAGLPVGTSEFFARIDQNRYGEYAPWLPAIAGFDRYRGKRLLEVGVGMGTDLAQFAKHGAIVTGVDLTPRHLEIARQRFALEGLEADLRLGDAESLPFADESFDVVYSFGVLHHTPGTEQAVREIHRVLVLGGVAIIGLYHRHSVFYRKLLVKEALRGNFAPDSHREAMARIEQREHGDASPLVKVYSSRQMRQLLSDFSSISIQVKHLEASAFGPLQRLVPDWVLPRLEPYVGWYVFAHAGKG